MKKIISIMGILILFASILAGCESKVDPVDVGIVPEETETPTPEKVLPEGVFSFGRVFLLDDNVAMTTPYALNNGGIRYESDEFELRQLPDAVNESGEVYNFTVYDDRIYFLTCEGGSDIEPSLIFSCNMDGSDMTLLAADACNYSKCYILDGYIYYDVYPMFTDYAGEYSASYFSGYADGEIEYDPGIWRMALDGSNREKIVYGENVNLIFMSMEGLYYADYDRQNYENSKYHKSDFNGANVAEIDKNDERMEPYLDYQYIIDPNSDAVYRARDGVITIGKLNDSEEKVVADVSLDSSKYESVVFSKASADEVIYSIFSRDEIGNVAYLKRAVVN